jgi:hypothetical protein
MDAGIGWRRGRTPQGSPHLGARMDLGQRQHGFERLKRQAVLRPLEEHAASAPVLGPGPRLDAASARVDIDELPAWGPPGCPSACARGPRRGWMARTPRRSGPDRRRGWPRRRAARSGRTDRDRSPSRSVRRACDSSHARRSRASGRRGLISLTAIRRAPGSQPTAAPRASCHSVAVCKSSSIWRAFPADASS